MEVSANRGVHFQLVRPEGKACAAPGVVSTARRGALRRLKQSAPGNLRHKAHRVARLTGIL